LQQRRVERGVISEGRSHTYGGATKAYQIAALNEARVVNDELGGQSVVVIASATSEAARVYQRTPGVEFGLDPKAAAALLPGSLVDSLGGLWTVTEDALIPGSGVTLARLPTHQAFWFGWFQFHPDTELFSLSVN